MCFQLLLLQLDHVVQVLQLFLLLDSLGLALQLASQLCQDVLRRKRFARCTLHTHAHARQTRSAIGIDTLHAHCLFADHLCILELLLEVVDAILLLLDDLGALLQCLLDVLYLCVALLFHDLNKGIDHVADLARHLLDLGVRRGVLRLRGLFFLWHRRLSSSCFGFAQLQLGDKEVNLFLHLVTFFVMASLDFDTVVSELIDEELHFFLRLVGVGVQFGGTCAELLVEIVDLLLQLFGDRREVSLTLGQLLQ